MRQADHDGRDKRAELRTQAERLIMRTIVKLMGSPGCKRVELVLSTQSGELRHVDMRRLTEVSDARAMTLDEAREVVRARIASMSDDTFYGTRGLELVGGSGKLCHCGELEIEWLQTFRVEKQETYAVALT